MVSNDNKKKWLAILTVLSSLSTVVATLLFNDAFSLLKVSGIIKQIATAMLCNILIFAFIDSWYRFLFGNAPIGLIYCFKWAREVRAIRNGAMIMARIKQNESLTSDINRRMNMIDSIKEMYKDNLAKIDVLIAQKGEMQKQQVAQAVAETENTIVAQKYAEIDRSLAELANAMRGDVEKQISAKVAQAQQVKAEFKVSKANEVTAQVTAQFLGEIGQLENAKKEIEKKLAE